MLSDLSVGDMAASLSSKPSPSPSSTRNANITHKTSTQQSKLMYTSNQTSTQQPASKVISFAKQSEPFGTWESPSPLEPLQPSPSNAPLQPQPAPAAGSSFTSVASQPIGLTSSTYKPLIPQSKVSNSSGYTGVTPLAAQNTHSQSLFSGMQVTTQASQSSTPQFTRSSALLGTTQGTQQQGMSSQGSMFSGMEINSGTVGNQPLVPTPAQPNNPNPMGWSSSVGGNSSLASGNSSTGWSSNVNPNAGWSSNVNPSASTGWSSNVNPSTVNPSTGWSQGMAGSGTGIPQYGSGTGQYMQNNMAGGMSQFGAGVNLQQQSPSVVHKSNKQAPSGSNPFADLNFLG